MTNRILVAGVVLASLTFPALALADENGMVGGAVAGAVGGAVVGGPVGFVVGGVGGAVVGNEATNGRPRHYYSEPTAGRYRSGRTEY